jgi:hypothetical protein
MREIVVSFLTYLVESHPYLLLGCASIGFMWFIRSALHKLRLYTQTLVKEVRGSKAELREWGDELTELRQELTSWRPEATLPHATDAHSGRRRESDRGAA